jgi:4-hydroxy-4-methyl-2-oxoglutarate aldolase
MTIDIQASTSVLYSAVLSDVMDCLGLMHQAMAPFVRPLDDGLVMMGRARTGLYMDVYAIEDGEDPYDVEIAMVDDLKQNDVAVLACRGPTLRIAPWGELLSTASRCRGASGCVTDGLVRDIRKIRDMKFPVFHGGIGPLDSKGRAKMMKRDVAVDCAGVRVHPGDIVFGDADGVVVVPQARAEEVIELACKKVASENHTRDALLQGQLLREVYDRFGVL